MLHYVTSKIQMPAVTGEKWGQASCAGT